MAGVRVAAAGTGVHDQRAVVLVVFVAAAYDDRIGTFSRCARDPMLQRFVNARRRELSPIHIHRSWRIAWNLSECPGHALILYRSPDRSTLAGRSAASD
jgi:hypothetical protein